MCAEIIELLIITMDNIHICCPKCKWEPDRQLYWQCTCGTNWTRSPPVPAAQDAARSGKTLKGKLAGFLLKTNNEDCYLKHFTQIHE
jgi:hypothetical protein